MRLYRADRARQFLPADEIVEIAEWPVAGQLLTPPPERSRLASASVRLNSLFKARGLRCDCVRGTSSHCQHLWNFSMQRILVVEDDVALQLFIEHVLMGAGYEVDAIGTISGGADLLRSRRYDLV